MSKNRIAYRYDKSLLQMAIEKGVLEEVHNDMLLLDRIVNENRMFALMLRNPVISHQKKLNILKGIFKGRVNQLTMALFEILSRKNREDILPEIAAVFHEQYNEYKGISEATVIAPYTIDDKERSEFEAIVRKATEARQVALQEKVDPSLIGGFIIKIGDKQIDNSLTNKLRELKQQFES